MLKLQYHTIIKNLVALFHRISSLKNVKKNLKNVNNLHVCQFLKKYITMQRNNMISGKQSLSIRIQLLP